jgi:hypothetical protein
MSTTSYQKPFTKTYTTPVTIQESDFLTRVTVIGVGGSITMRGTSTFQGQQSDDIVIPEGVSWTEIAGQYSFLGGITFTPASSMLFVSYQ